MKKIIVIVLCFFASANLFATAHGKKTDRLIKMKTLEKPIFFKLRTIGTWCGATVTVDCPDAGCTFTSGDIWLINQTLCHGQGPQ